MRKGFNPIKGIPLHPCNNISRRVETLQRGRHA